MSKTAYKLADFLAAPSDFTQINLRNQKIGDKGIEALVEIFTENMHIEYLNLSDNRIGSKGIEALAKILKENIDISHLDFSSNALGDKGIEALAEALERNTHVSYLNFSGNVLGDKGIEALAKTLKENTRIEYLDFSKNEIGDKGIETLAEVLKENTHVKHLNFSENKIGDEGIEALAEALKKNTHIEYLNFSKNEIGDKGVETLAETLKENAHIYHLDFSDNQIGIEGAEAFAEIIFEGIYETRYIGLLGNKIPEELAELFSDRLEVKGMDMVNYFNILIDYFPNLAFRNPEEAEIIFSHVTDSQTLYKKSDEQKAKSLNTYMTTLNIKEFKEALNKNTIDTYINKYIDEHSERGVETYSDFYSLLLGTAISVKDTDLVAHILSIPHDNQNLILTAIDSSHFNPVTTALYSNNQTIIKQIGDYIKKHSTQLQLNKIHIDEELIEELSSVLISPPNNLDSEDCLNNYLVPLYNQDSIQKLIGCIEGSYGDSE